MSCTAEMRDEKLNIQCQYNAAGKARTQHLKAKAGQEGAKAGKRWHLSTEHC